MRFVIGKISHESNTFSVIPTDLAAFAERGLYRGDDIFAAFDDTNTPLGGFLAGAAAEGVELISTIAADATPAGPVTRAAFLALLDDLVSGVRTAGTIDAVLLQLHGAMVTEDCEDGEGVILSAVRDAVGPHVPVVTTLDLHGNVTDQMIAQATALFGYDTNPHIDGFQRGLEAFNAAVRIVKGQSRPVMAKAQPPIMPHPLRVRTDTGPLVELFERARKWEAHPAVINVSVFGGWPHVDVRDAGLSCVAVTENDPQLARRIARDISQLALNRLPEFLPGILVPIEDAVRRAVEAPAGPVILAEIGDSPAGGSSGDGTFTLRALLDAGAADAAIVLRDADAVAEACRRGVRSPLAAEVGGKTDRFHGNPVRVEGIVRALTDGVYRNRGPMATGVEVDLGRNAVLRVGDDFDILLTERRISPVDPEVFRQAGIEPSHKKILVLKSGGHFRAAYTSMAAEIIDVDTPGVTAADLTCFHYEKVRRPVFPLDKSVGP
ncbi:MAG: M81 family metallopeptidase [Bacillota bacterium]